MKQQEVISMRAAAQALRASTERVTGARSLRTEVWIPGTQKNAAYKTSSCQVNTKDLRDKMPN